MTLNHLNKLDILFSYLLPLFLLVLLIIMEALLPSKYYSFFVGENGPLELFQFILIVLAALLSLFSLKLSLEQKRHLLSIFFFIIFTGTIYIGGEEVSWGQHFFNWSTPETWAKLNDQNETNLHNTSSWLDQKPRLILELGVIVGGIIIPTLLRFKISALPKWLIYISPPGRMFVIALCFIIVKFSDKLGDLTSTVIFRRASEMTEMYIYYFILIYLFYFIKSLKKEIN